MMQIPVTVVILAAGLGTRMKSRKAKVLHRAGGRPLIAHVVETALKLAPAERIFVVVGYQAEEVRKAVAEAAGGSGIGFIEQKEQKGTGHALMAGREALAGLDGYLAIVYGDGPLLRAETLERLVLNHIGAVSGCVCVLQRWDDARRHLVRTLRALGLPLLVLLVTRPGGKKPDAGPMRDEPENFHVLEIGQVEKQLAGLK